ncbi:MAG: hypothetical protein ACRD0J_15080 [Acidimicrobiales bacterium]
MDPAMDDDGSIALVELSLNTPHPDFCLIIRVDERGIWYGDTDDADLAMAPRAQPVWRLSLVPWRHIEGITLHKAS